MLKIALALCTAFILMLGTSQANADSRAAAQKAEAEEITGTIIGKPAPDFTAIDSNGKTHKLSDFKGKIVVLEWTNSGCPFVQKFYDSNTMQTMQKEAADRGVVWLSVLSSAKGEQGHMDGPAANRWLAKEKATNTTLLLDEAGTIGRLYSASTTPHMFVIDKNGVLAYAGAMDDQPSVSPATLKDAKNYVKAAIDSLIAGTPIATTTSKPYGCSVKY